MNSVWAVTGVVLLQALTNTLCQPTPALAALPAGKMVPPVVGNRVAPKPMVELGATHGHTEELKAVPESEMKSQVVPESSSRDKVAPELATNHKVADKPEGQHTVVPEPEAGHKVADKPATENKVVLEPAAKPDGIMGALRTGGLEAMPERRPGHVRPGDAGDAAAATTTTTTVDPFTAFCQEACKAGVGGPECNCPGHPVGRRHAPSFTP